METSRESSDIVAGIDGGVTSTKIALSDLYGRILIMESGGGVNPHLGCDRAVHILIQVLNQNLEKVVDEFRLRSAVLGVTGTEAEAVRSKVEEGLKEYVKDVRIRVVHDSEIALAGALAGDEGVVIYGGTGSFAVGMNSRGKVCRVGGYGFLSSDQGSAFYIGHQALIAAARSNDGRGEDTSLVKALLEFFDVDQFEELAPIIYAKPFDTMKIADLAPLVDRVAEEGDKVAFKIIESAAHELADMVFTVVKRLGLQGIRVKISPVGGVFNSHILKEAFLKEIFKTLGDIVLVEAIFPPVVGAVILALEDAKVVITSEVIDSLKASFDGLSSSPLKAFWRS